MKFTFERAIEWVNQQKVPIDVDKIERASTEVQSQFSDSVFLVKGMVDYINFYFPQSFKVDAVNLFPFITDQTATSFFWSKPSKASQDEITTSDKLSGKFDYQIDAIVLINEKNELISDSSSLKSVKNVIIFQSKNTSNGSVKEAIFHSPINGLKQVLDFLQDPNSTGSLGLENSLPINLFNDLLGAKISKLSGALLTSVCIVTNEPRENVKTDFSRWVQDIQLAFNNDKFPFQLKYFNQDDNMEFIWSHSIIFDHMIDNLIDQQRVESREVNKIEKKKMLEVTHLNYEPLSSDKADAYIGMSYLKDYIKMLSTDQNNFDDQIVKDNVRDNQRRAAANKEITQTLTIPDPIVNPSEFDFWWFNNGITIIVDAIKQISPRSFELTNPQIVNGQQTSRQIFDQRHHLINSEWKVSIKLIVIPQQNDPVSQNLRYKIIKGVNTQTKLNKGQILGLTDRVRRLSNYILHETNNHILLSVRDGEENPNGELIFFQKIIQLVEAGINQNPSKARNAIGTLTEKEFDTVFSENNTKNENLVVDSWVSFLKNIINFDELFFERDWSGKFSLEKKREFGDQYSYFPIFTILNFRSSKENEFLEKLNELKIGRHEFINSVDLWHAFIEFQKDKDSNIDLDNYIKSSSLTKDLIDYLALH